MRVKTKNKYIYTLKQTLRINTPKYANVSSDAFLNEVNGIGRNANFVKNFPEVFILETPDSTLTLDEHCERLINYLFNDHYDDIVSVIERDTEPDESVRDELQEDFFFCFLNKLNSTAPRYKSLLKLYKDKENKLLDGIKSTTTGETRFNDTPQNDGEFDDDRHNTNITKTKGDVVSDGLTPMQRLKEVQEAYRNLIEDWAKEFRMFFIAPSNYEVEEDE